LGNLARLLAADTSLSYSGQNYDIMKSDINNGLLNLNEWAKLLLVDSNPKTTKALADPWGTPVLTVLGFEHSFLTNTFCF
jgi:hypothetical protein